MTMTNGDRFPAELVHLISTATSVVNEHVNDRGLCAICGSAWPCERAVVAGHNLAAF
jgi:hypothetical protein